MGTTLKPLKIVVLPPYHQDLWVLELAQKGHIVTLLDSDHQAFVVLDADLILGPTCARFLPGMEAYLDQFIKGARALKDWSKVIKSKEKKDD